MRLCGLGLIALALLAAGCGQAKAPTYKADTSEQCVAARGARTSGAVDFVASTATGGAFKATLAHNFVTVSFGLTSADADAIDAGYRRFAGANIRAGLDDVLRRESNAIMLWHEHPSDADVALVTGCLK